MDTVRVYFYCSGGEVDEVPKLELNHMVEYQYGLGEARQQMINMEESNKKCR